MNDPTTTPLKKAGIETLPQGWDEAAQSGDGDWSVNKSTDGSTHVKVTNLPATQPVSGTVTANIGTTNGIALDGTDATGVTPPTGATGIRGWLSALYNLFFGGTAKVVASGTVTANQGTANATPWNVAVTNSSVPDAQSLPVHTTGKKASLQEINASASAAVATGTTNIALVYAPAGKIARVRELGVYINGPAGAASGTHRLLIGLGMTLNGSVTNTSVLDSGPVAYNALIGLYKPAWFSTVAGQFPTDYQGLQKAKEALVFTDTVPLRLIYTNNTDVAQNGNREVRLLCELEAIV